MCSSQACTGVHMSAGWVYIRHTRTCVCMHMCMISIEVCTCVSTLSIHVNVCVHVCVLVGCMPTEGCVCVLTSGMHVHVCVHMCACTCVYTSPLRFVCVCVCIEGMHVSITSAFGIHHESGKLWAFTTTTLPWLGALSHPLNLFPKGLML